MSPDRAVGLLLRTLAEHKQLAVIVGWCSVHGHRLIGITYSGEAALTMLRIHEVGLIVVAMPTRSAELHHLESDALRFGGQLEYVRQPIRQRLDVDPLVLRMVARGLDPEVIADLLGVPPERISALLNRYRTTPVRRGPRMRSS